MSAPARAAWRAQRGTDERQRVGDRDAPEAEPTQPPVGRRLDRRAEARPVERVRDHHAGDAGADRSPERREVPRPDVRVDVRPVVGRDRGRPEAGEVLDAGGVAETAREGDADLPAAELAPAERPVGRVEHRGEVDVDAGAAEGGARRAAGAQRLCRRGEGRRPPPGRRARQRLDAPALLIGETDLRRAREDARPLRRHDHQLRLLRRRQRHGREQDRERRHYRGSSPSG
jgi:hypothetical protein